MKTKLTLFFALSLIAYSCSTGGGSEQDSTETEATVETPEVTTKTAVCVWNNISVREQPGAETKYLTAISIGESLTYLGEDSVVANKTYAKVQLNDGQEGWSRKDFIVIDAKPAVILKDISLYSRPDLLTKTDKIFSAMDIVSSMETQDDWMQIRGKRSEGKWLDEGWVKSENISFSALDIATAKFASKALAIEDSEEQLKALKELINNQDLNESKFMAGLVVKLTQLSESMATEEAPVDSMP